MGNPDGITRLFVGNLNRKITEDQLRNAIDGITHIKWYVNISFYSRLLNLILFLSASQDY